MTPVIVRAVYDYEARQHNELSFKKGDRMELVGDRQSPTTMDWWTARHIGSGLQGYIPSNYVVIDNNNPESQEWWFDIDRRDADKLLAGNPCGTFLIRASSDKNSFAISIHDYDKKEKRFVTKHYLIHKLDKGGVFISNRRKFNNINEVINHHKHSTDGLCCRLTKPCPKEPEPIPFKDIEVDRESFQLLEKLGGGQFGEVFKGRWRNQLDVALKTLRPGHMTVKAFVEEAKIMHRLRHRKLVQLMGVCTKEEPLYIITELMVNGALHEYLSKDKGRTIKLMELIDMSAQVADGMQYLEQQNYVHRDLRAGNILVAENNMVKVADFGLARLTNWLEDNNRLFIEKDDTNFPIKWTSPEAAFDHKFSIKSDVWSYGVLLYEMITYGRIPYPGMDNRTVLQSIKNGYRMPQPAGPPMECPDYLYDLMLMCWHKEPERRPTFEYLKSVFEAYSVTAEISYKDTEGNC